jgi:hypothetical protein
MATAVLEVPRVNGEAMVPSNGEVTNAELARRLDTLSRELQADLGEIIRRMDSYVLREVYQSDQRRREDQITALTAQLATERTERSSELERLRANVRWWWTAVVVPVGAFIVNLLLQARGGG